MCTTAVFYSVPRPLSLLGVRIACRREVNFLSIDYSYRDEIFWPRRISGHDRIATLIRTMISERHGPLRSTESRCCWQHNVILDITRSDSLYNAREVWTTSGGSTSSGMSPCTPVAPILNLDANFVAFSPHISCARRISRAWRKIVRCNNDVTDCEYPSNKIKLTNTDDNRRYPSNYVWIDKFKRCTPNIHEIAQYIENKSQLMSTNIDIMPFLVCNFTITISTITTTSTATLLHITITIF